MSYLQYMKNEKVRFAIFFKLKRKAAKTLILMVYIKMPTGWNGLKAFLRGHLNMFSRKIEHEKTSFCISNYYSFYYETEIQ